MLSIIIPARTEKYLNKTIEDILSKATGEIEIFPVLDGYPDDYPYQKIVDLRVRYITLPPPLKDERRKRQAVNTAVSISSGEYVMWIDAHCVVAEGFDEILIRDCEDEMVMVPRRHKLDPDTWDKKRGVQRPPVDYQYWMWRNVTKDRRFKHYMWDRKTNENTDKMIDDIFICQGSFVFMKRNWFDICGFMKTDGYTGWGQEGEEICLQTIKMGGRAVVNKNTWYAHLNKHQMTKRQYKWTDVTDSYDYAFKYWVHEQRPFFEEIINKFGPFPNWPEDWKDKVYGDT